MKKWALCAALCLLLLTACTGAAPSSSGSVPTEQSSSQEQDSFLQACYELGYTDEILNKITWEWSEEEYYNPPMNELYDRSPNGEWVLYGTGDMQIPLTVCKNESTGEVRILPSFATDFPNRSFIGDDKVSIFSSFSGGVYTLAGETVLEMTLDPEAMGYYIYAPVWNPQANTLSGVGLAYKDGNSPENMHPDSTFAILHIGQNGEISAELAGIPIYSYLPKGYSTAVVSVPDHSYYRDEALYFAFTYPGAYPAEEYVFYRYAKGVGGGMETQKITREEVLQALPGYHGKI